MKERAQPQCIRATVPATDATEGRADRCACRAYARVGPTSWCRAYARSANIWSLTMTRADHVNMILLFASDIAAQAESMEYLNADLSSIVEELSRVHEHMPDLLAAGTA